jgi:hypothetical protein
MDRRISMTSARRSGGGWNLTVPMITPEICCLFRASVNH